MHFDILTLFPALFDSVFRESIVRRAIDAGQVQVQVHNIRDYAHDRHHVTDDAPYGGGGGMVMKVEPIILALESILSHSLPLPNPLPNPPPNGPCGQVPIVLMSPAGQGFDQKMARGFERAGHIILICGRYEGVDQRVSELGRTREVSIGDYVLSGGEIPAMVIVEAVTRLVPGVLGDMRALVDDSYASGLLEYPHYTRPAEFRGSSVPDVLLSGDHARVARWRRDQALKRTWERRPDLLNDARLTERDRQFLETLHPHQDSDN